MSQITDAEPCDCHGGTGGVRIECAEYLYENERLPYVAKLFVSQDRICFRSPHGTTGWHGRVRFESYPTDAIVLRFNYRGAGNKNHPAHVCRVNGGIYRGVDYKMRNISMTHLRTWVWCHLCQEWR